MTAFCPQCGCECGRLEAGICRDCYRDNHEELLLHNASFDRWERLSDDERDDEIRRAYQ